MPALYAKGAASERPNAAFSQVCSYQNTRHKNNLQKSEKDFARLSKSATLNRPWVIETLK